MYDKKQRNAEFPERLLFFYFILSIFDILDIPQKDIMKKRDI